MIPLSIKDTLGGMDGEIDRNENEIVDVKRNLEMLGLKEDEQISQFFIRFNSCSIVSKRDFELLDLCFPNDEIFETTEWAKDVYQLPKDYICLTSGEGEGFILFSKIDSKIYDVSVSEFSSLALGKVNARWESFFELMTWYLVDIQTQ